MADFSGTLCRLVAKELRVEFRSRGMISTAISFALCSLVMAGTGFGGVIRDAKTASVLFWIIALFTAMSGRVPPFLPVSVIVVYLKGFGNRQFRKNAPCRFAPRRAGNGA